MTLAITFAKTPGKNTDAALLLVLQDGKLGKDGAKIDKASHGYITQAIRKTGGFTGKHGESLTLALPGK